MKIVKNNCFGGFSLSNKAEKRLAELEGKEYYVFKTDYSEGYDKKKNIPVDINEKGMFVHAYSVPNPDELSDKERNEKYIYYRDIPRDSPLLLQVIEELGLEESSGSCAELEIVEIPDDVDWEIDEYDGLETIREKHRSW